MVIEEFNEVLKSICEALHECPKCGDMVMTEVPLQWSTCDQCEREQGMEIALHGCDTLNPERSYRMSKQNGRRAVSHSLYDRHVEVQERLASESGLTDSEIIRALLELVSDCHAVWQGPFLKFERPKFRWGAKEEGRFL